MRRGDRARHRPRAHGDDEQWARGRACSRAPRDRKRQPPCPRVRRAGEEPRRVSAQPERDALLALPDYVLAGSMRSSRLQPKAAAGTALRARISRETRCAWSLKLAVLSASPAMPSPACPHRRSCATQIRHHEERYYIHERSRRSPTRSSTVCCTSSSARGASIPTSSRPIRRPSAWPAGRSRGSRRSSIWRRCSASTTPTPRTSCARSTSACARARRLGDAAVAYVAEMKIDGLSIALTYEDGRSTRGDARRRRAGRRRHVERAHDSRRFRWRCATGPPGRIEVRGEIYLPRASFERINREREEAGRAAVRQSAQRRGRHDAESRSRRWSRGAAWARSMYQLPSAPAATTVRQPQPTHCWSAARARWGLPVEPHWRRCAGIDAVVAFCANGPEQRPTLEFDTDGVVIKVDDLALRERLAPRRSFRAGRRRSSSRRSRRPRAAHGIEVNVGRTGAVTPYAVLEPVRLAGSTISMATLHNAEDVARKDMRAGDTRAHRKGRRRHPQGREADPRRVPRARSPGRCRPTCPAAAASCSAPKRKSSGAARTRSCPARSGAAWSTSRRGGAMNIEGLGESLVDQLVDQGLVHDFADLYALDAPAARSAGRDAAGAAVRNGAAAQARQGRAATSSRRSSGASRTTSRG